jgi:xylulokinase
VVAGGHDQTCAALGAGAVQPGLASYATGTVECICPVFSTPQFSNELFAANLCCYDYSVKGMYATVAYSLTGGNILKWFKDEFCHAETYEQLMETLPEEPTQLMTLPYFTPTGTPYFDTTTSGAILGLRLTTKRNEILKSLLEGVAFEMRLNIELMEQSAMQIKEFVVTGGGARSLTWSQLKADIMDKPMKVTDIKEAGCFGAAMLACAVDTGKSLLELTDSVKYSSKVLTPNPERSSYYKERFDLYRQLYPVMRKLSIKGR